jgi:hypothetical protein
MHRLCNKVRNIVTHFVEVNVSVKVVMYATNIVHGATALHLMLEG